MTEKELRELDAWIFERIFGGALALTGSHYPLPHYTTDPAAAMAVLEKCLAKISTGSLEIYQGADEGPEYRPIFCIGKMPTEEVVMDESLTLAICLFAKKLFEK